MVDQDLNESPPETTGQTSGADHHSAKPAPQPNMIAFLLPLIILLFLSAMSPNFQTESPAPNAAGNYLWLIIAEVVVLTVVLACFWKVYLSHFPMTMDYLGIVVGALGFILWIGICSIGLERTALTALGLPDWLPERSGFDPYLYFSQNIQLTAFILFRFTLLCLIVPICEELFLRGWLVRYVENPKWETVRLTSIGWRGCLAVVVYAAATHPAEAIAAIAWFSLVSWLMIKSGKFWNCVLAHAVTNLMLGVYVMWSHEWQYW